MLALRSLWSSRSGVARYVGRELGGVEAPTACRPPFGGVRRSPEPWTRRWPLGFISSSWPSSLWPEPTQISLWPP